MDTPSLNTVIAAITDHQEEVREFGVRSLAVFGSVSRGDAREQSDVDLLVEFARPPSFDDYLGLNLYLEDLLRRKVDLVTATSLKPAFRTKVEREAIYVPGF
jgi:predicted nucleotidyltransferase